MQPYIRAKAKTSAKRVVSCKQLDIDSKTTSLETLHQNNQISIAPKPNASLNAQRPSQGKTHMSRSSPEGIKDNVVRKVLLSLNGAIHLIIDDQRIRIDRSHTTIVCDDVVQCGVLVPGLAGTLELTGVRDGLPDLLLGFDDLEGETHRHVPSDMAMHAKKFRVSIRADM